MRHIEVDFVARVKLMGIIGGAPARDGGLDKLHALLGVFQQIRFSDEENEQITVKPISDREAHYQITDPEAAGAEFGRKTVALEEAQLEWLRRQLRQWGSEHATIHDLEWFDPLMRKLEGGARREPRGMEVKRKR